MRRCSTPELPSARGTPSPDPRHTPRQRRAHRTGMRARAAVDRSSDVPHWPLVEEANPCALHPACRPCRSIKARRIHAPARFFPASGQQCPDASGARCNRVVRAWIPCERQKENTPGCWNPRAFALPREIGATDLRDAKGSVDGVGTEIIPLAVKRQRAAPFARAQARIASGRWHVGCDVERGLHGIRVFKKSPRWRRSRTLRASFAFRNKKFTSPTSGMHFRGERKKETRREAGFFSTSNNDEELDPRFRGDDVPAKPFARRANGPSRHLILPSL